ncbi:MAG: hypothetical protein ISN29_02535 [Gammaproteobacteria bacterium AqS3]|nr:hypothetical protein [Gammaproteobacteria bacterium AqS3]
MHYVIEFWVEDRGEWCRFDQTDYALESDALDMMNGYKANVVANGLSVAPPIRVEQRE